MLLQLLYIRKIDIATIFIDQKTTTCNGEVRTMTKLILLRHGLSQWNKANLFTGWVDVPLCKEGIEEAEQAGKALKDEPIDIVFCSALIRSIMTAMIALAEHSSGKTPVIQHAGGDMERLGTIFSDTSRENTIPVFLSEALNERMYGSLQGLNKQETREKYGNEQVQLWRRSYAINPPNGESLKETCARTIPYFESTILPHLQAGKNVFISAHGNSLRAVIKYLERFSDDAIAQFEIATGVPRLYEMKEGSFQLL